MLWSIPIARIAGTVVRVHITFLLFLVWIAGTHWRLGGQAAALDGVLFIVLLFACVLASLFAWWRTIGSFDVNTVATPREEIFYWITITFSQTLGTALGDWSADPLSEGGWGLGYSGGALVFGAGLAILAILYFSSKVSRVFLFWAAFILTRPLGATVGDWLDKPLAKGGLALSRPIATAALAVAILALILLLPQRAGQHPGAAPSPS